MTTPLTLGHDGAREDHRNPVLLQTPHEAREALTGKRPRPHYAPQPVGPSRQDIHHAKSQLVRHRHAVDHTQAQLRHLEAQLCGMCPQRVVACVVPGYIDPPERVARAKADKEAGVFALLGQFCTPEILQAHRDGKLARPEFVGFFHTIYELKRQIVHYRTLVQHTEAHNDFLESDLSLLDPQHVVAARVSGYVDPPETVARAAAAKAAGEVPATHEGM